ncbi:retrovirus-related pol polyprotein from transposon TNT 1-94 [Tanacetum coccineum]
MLAILRSIIGGFDLVGNQGLKLIDQELVMIQGSGLKIEERLKGLESFSHHYKQRSDHTVKIIYHDVNYASKVEIDCAKAKDSLAKTDFSKSKSVTTINVSNDFSKPVTLQILPQNVKSILKNTNVIALGMYKVHTKPNQTRTPQLPQEIRKTKKCVSFSTGVISTTSVSRPQLKSNQLEDRVMHNNSEGRKQQVEGHRRNFRISNNKMSVTACNDSLNAKTSNVNFVCVTCGKCVLNDNHEMCVLHYINGVNSRTKMPMDVPISTREPKRTVNQSAATPLKRTVAAESTNQKPRSTIRKQYEQISKTCRWWYCKIKPPGYKWKPKSRTVNVEPNVSMHLGTKSRTTTISEPTTLRKSTISNTPSSSNSFAACMVKFGNDQIALILGYGDLVQGNITINRGNDLLTGSHGTDLYSITLQDTSTPNPICLMAKATSSQAWLCHHRLSHLNFNTINLLSKYDIVTGLPKLKFVKDHLCSSCELGKAKWIEHQTSTARTPEQNGVVERRNRTLVEAARTMLSAAKVHLFFWAEAIATTCFTQNRSLVILQHEKTPYHIINGRKPSVKFFYIFGSLCYIVIDGENLDKMKEKGDACIFVGYSTQSRAYRVYNKRTGVIVETIHVNFDELPQMASDHVTEIVTTSNEMDLLFSPMFDELLNEITPVVSKSSAVTTADAPNQRQHKKTTSSTSTTVAAYIPLLNIQTIPETTSQAPT